MNNRIFEIIQGINGQVGLQWEEKDKQELAELIVKECVNNLKIHSTCFDGDVGRGIKTAARLTKEHFGVEE